MRHGLRAAHRRTGFQAANLIFKIGTVQIGIMLGQRAKGFLGRPPLNGDLVKGAFAGFLGLLHLDDPFGPLPSPGVDRRQVEAKGIYDLTSQIFDGIPLSVRRLLWNDKLLIDQNAKRCPDGALRQAGPAD